MITAYIQKESGEFQHEFCFNAYISFVESNWWNRKKEYDIQFCSLKEINETLKSKDSLFVGTIEFVKKSFKEVYKINCPPPLNIPNSISSFTKRKLSIGYLKDLQYPCFVKPNKDVKLFTGSLLKNNRDLNILIPELKEDTELFISEPEEFISEWRCFVYKKKLIDSKNYGGDFKLSPNYEMVEQCILEYTDCPIAYAIDFGITNKGETKLIEVNDFWSCGTYGFSGETYERMLKDRFFEIVGNNGRRV
jgi:hypothetical protein